MNAKELNLLLIWYKQEERDIEAALPVLRQRFENTQARKAVISQHLSALATRKWRDTTELDNLPARTFCQAIVPVKYGGFNFSCPNLREVFCFSCVEIKVSGTGEKRT